VRYAPALLLSTVIDGPLALPLPWAVVAQHAPGPLVALADLTHEARTNTAEGSSLVLLYARADFAAATGPRDEAELVNTFLDQTEQLQPGFRSRVRAKKLYREARARIGFDVGHYRKLARLRREELFARGTALLRG